MAIELTLKRIKENNVNQRIKKIKVKPEKAKKKRPLNWKSYKGRIAKYDSLTKKEKGEANKSWGRTIPSARKALALHNKGYSDTKIRKEMGWSK